MANIKHIFKVSKTAIDNAITSQKYHTAAPTLEPVNKINWHAGKYLNRHVDTQLIDVVNGFEWTHTPRSGRHEIPYVRMSEYQVEFSTLLQSIRYVLTLGADSLDQMSDTVQQKIDLVQKAAESGKTVMNWLLEKVPGGSTVKAAAKTAKDVGLIGTPNSVPSYLKPYYGLYGTQGTGFEYTFPYFESQWKEVGTRWADFKGGGGLFSSFVNELFSAEGLGKDLLEMGKFLPGVKGTYIERAQEYTYGEMPTWTFKFNLLNTAEYNDVVKNWQLCYLLSYQNLPNKTSKTLLDPPVIYEVEVPGIFYTPYAYISRLSIQNRGALRLAKIPILQDQAGMMKLTTGAGKSGTNMTRKDWLSKKDGSTAWNSLVSGPNDTQQLFRIQETMGYEGTGSSSGEEVLIETLVPDAYEIQITIQSLIPESKNLLYHSILGPAARATGIYNIGLSNPDKALGKLGTPRSKADQSYEDAGNVNWIGSDATNRLRGE